MKIPKEIRIGNYTIPIGFEDKETMTTLLGQFVPIYEKHSPRIRIRKGMGIQAEFETFIHEVIEGVESIYDIGLNHSQIQILGVALAQALDGMINTGE